MAKLVTDSVLPIPLQNQRFLIIESLLQRLNTLPQHIIIMLIDIVDGSALMAFADQFSLLGDGWEFAKTETEQRELIKGAIEIHRHKGTPWAIKRTLQLLGYENCQIIERYGLHEHDGVYRHDGAIRYESAGHWTHYYLYIPYLITEMEANNIRNLLKDVAPLRCLLTTIRMRLQYDGSILHDGKYRHEGVITWQAN